MFTFFFLSVRIGLEKSRSVFFKSLLPFLTESRKMNFSIEKKKVRKRNINDIIHPASFRLHRDARSETIFVKEPIEQADRVVSINMAEVSLDTAGKPEIEDIRIFSFRL